jgi:hypothetical protein
VKRLRFGEAVQCTKREAYTGIAVCLAYIAVLLGFVYVTYLLGMVK